jgi:hypothetical protein
MTDPPSIRLQKQRSFVIDSEVILKGAIIPGNIRPVGFTKNPWGKSEIEIKIGG